MIRTLQFIYQSPDLMGDSLLLINQHSFDFFAKKVEKGSPLAKIAWTIATVAYGIFAVLTSPLLVPLGMGLKMGGVILHNRNQIKKLQTTLAEIRTQNRFVPFDERPASYPHPLIIDYGSPLDLSKYEDSFQHAIEEIQESSWKFRQFYTQLEIWFNKEQEAHYTLNTYTRDYRSKRSTLS